MLVTASALVAVGRALAIPPTVTAVHWHSSDTYIAGSLCPFAVSVVIDQDFRTTTFYDADGSPRTMTQHTTAGTIVANLDTGRQVTVTQAFTVTETLPTASVSAVVTGRTGTIFDPDGGVLAMQAGRLVWDYQSASFTFQAGRNDPLQYCEELGN